jgi:hypothetical protein
MRGAAFLFPASSRVGRCAQYARPIAEHNKTFGVMRRIAAFRSMKLIVQPTAHDIFREMGVVIIMQPAGRVFALPLSQVDFSD